MLQKEYSATPAMNQAAAMPVNRPAMGGLPEALTPGAFGGGRFRTVRIVTVDRFGLKRETRVRLTVG
jgi:hypothetical protein